MLELIEFRIGELRELRIGETAHQKVHFADAAMPGAESNAAAADLAVHLRRVIGHVNSIAAGSPLRAVHIVVRARIATRQMRLKWTSIAPAIRRGASES